MSDEPYFLARVTDDAPGSPHSRVVVYGGPIAGQRAQLGALTCTHQEAVALARLINGEGDS